MRKYLLIFAMLAIVLTACRIESNVNLDIEEDGSAVVLVEVGFDEEFRQLMTGQTGGSEEDFVNEILSVGDTSLVQRSEGDMTYYGAAQEIEDLSQGLPVEAAEEMFTSFDYSFDEDGASLTARIQSIDTGEFGGAGDLGGLAEGLTGDIFSANLVVRMPGEVTAHNADEVRSDGALAWNIPLAGAVDVQAESSFGTSTTSWFWFGLLMVVIVVAAVSAGIAVIVSRKSSEKAVAAAIAAHQAAGAEGEVQPIDDEADEVSSETETDDSSGDPTEGAPAPEEGDVQTTDVGSESEDGAEQASEEVETGDGASDDGVDEDDGTRTTESGSKSADADSDDEPVTDA
jgi:hypothetical protein